MKSVRVSFDGHGLNDDGVTRGERVATFTDKAKAMMVRGADGRLAPKGERIGDLFEIASLALEVVVRIGKRMERHVSLAATSATPRREFVLDGGEILDLLTLTERHRKILPDPIEWDEAEMYPEPWAVVDGGANVCVVDANGNNVAVFNRTSEDVGAAKAAAAKMVETRRQIRSIRAAEALVKGLL